jgi:hypothetical protein
MASISFAKVQGAGQSAPVAPLPVNEPTPVETDALPSAPAAEVPSTALAGQNAHLSGRVFFGGDEDDAPENDRGDVKLPRLNLIQGLSNPELKKLGVDGTFVLKSTLALPQPLRIVVAGCSRKRYAEKMPKFGEGTPRILDSLEEVYKAGGTEQWRVSRENKDNDGIPVSRKAWFMPMVTALLLVQKPEKLANPDDEAHFASVSEDGVAFAPCVYTVKSTSFGSFYVPLNSEKSAGVLRGGFFTHYVLLTSKQNRAIEPVVKIVEPTSEAVRKLAKSLLC